MDLVDFHRGQACQDIGEIFLRIDAGGFQECTFTTISTPARAWHWKRIHRHRDLLNLQSGARLSRWHKLVGFTIATSAEQLEASSLTKTRVSFANLLSTYWAPLPSRTH